MWPIKATFSSYSSDSVFTDFLLMWHPPFCHTCDALSVGGQWIHCSLHFFVKFWAHLHYFTPEYWAQDTRNTLRASEFVCSNFNQAACLPPIYKLQPREQTYIFINNVSRRYNLLYFRNNSLAPTDTTLTCFSIMTALVPRGPLTSLYSFK